MIKEFLNRLHIPGTLVQVSTLNKVLETYDTGFDTTDIVEKNKKENIFFLAGVDLFSGKERASNSDVLHRKYVVLDYDLRKDVDGDVTDEEIKQMGLDIGTELDKHKNLKEWSYIVFSGNGIHIYYIGDPIECNEFYTVGVDALYDRIEEVVPYKIDRACKNPARILRLPGSFNNKGEAKRVEIIAARERKAEFMGKLLAIGEKRMKERKEQASSIELTFSTQGENDKYRAINNIPIGGIVAKQMGWEQRGQSFYPPGGSKKKACFVSNTENVVIHNGTDHFSGECIGYSPYNFMNIAMGLSKADTFKYFEDEFREIADLAEKNREEWKKEQIVPPPEFKKSESVNSYTWGMDCIDAKITTPKKGRLVILVSDENTGKSTYMFFVARKNYEKYKHNVVYFNLEQTKDEVVNDMALQYIGATKLGIRDNIYDADPAFLARKKFLSEQNSVTFIGSKATELTTIESVERRLSEMEGVDMLILDNLTCLATESSDKNEQIKQIILRLSSLAVSLNIPIVLVHHYRKKSSNQETLFRDVHDIGGSGAIKDLAHTIIQVARTPNPTDKVMESEFHIREGKLRGGARKESICVLHDKGEFIEHAGLAGFQ